MTAYQIGYLVGTLIGAVLGFAIAYKLFKSPKKANRGLGVVVALLALAYVASAALKNGPGQQRKDFEAGFRKSCVSECGAGNSGQSLCETFCDCQISRLLGGADADRVIQSFEGVRSAADIAPEQRARMNVIAAECMPPELYDANFMAACTSSCTDPGCPETCRCFLGKLREGMDPVAGTQWILKNVESDPATAEGEARSSAAAAACGATAAGE